MRRAILRMTGWESKSRELCGIMTFDIPRIKWPAQRSEPYLQINPAQNAASHRETLASAGNRFLVSRNTVPRQRATVMATTRRKCVARISLALFPLKAYAAMNPEAAPTSDQASSGTLSMIDLLFTPLRFSLPFSLALASPANYSFDVPIKPTMARRDLPEESSLDGCTTACGIACFPAYRG